MSFRRLSAFSLAAALGLAAAAPLRAASQQKSDVEITVVEKRIVDPTPRGLTLMFVLNVKNLLTLPLMLSRYEYRAAIDGTEYLDLQVALDAPIRVEGREEARIGLPVKITYEFLYAVAAGLRDKDAAGCLVTGALIFRDDRGKERRTPLLFSGEFPIFRGVSVRLLPIEARDLTVGGADLVFRAAVENPNGFEFKVERLTYKLDLVGVTVKEGAAGQGTVVLAHGETPVAFPLLLDFFDLGRPLYDSLSQPPAPARLAGEIAISSVWGTFVIPFDTSAKVDVAKVS